MNRRIRRRDFLRSTLGASAAMSSAVGMGGLLNVMQAAAQDSSDNADYRALVCIFLLGGIDSFNVLIPTDNNYQAYAAARGPLAVGLNDVLPLTSDAGLNPMMPQLQSLYQSGNAAFVTNVGTLIEPTNKTAYESRAVRLPPQLFSHSDQQFQWQTGQADLNASQGWFGRIADLLESQNLNNQLPMNVSFFGSNTLQTGVVTAPYAASTEGAEGIELLLDDPEQAQRHQVLLDMARGPLEREYVRLRGRAAANYEAVSAALNAAPALSTAFPQSPLGSQLAAVARFLSVRDQLGASRQTFLVAIGDFDTHADQANRLPSLLSQIDGALNSFHDATVELGLANNVTTCSISDFGRTLSINGDGTDHGWGGHYFVTGGAVNSGIYGTMPSLEINGPDDTGDGALIPTLAVEEYGASLARWMGVADSNLDLVFPNLGNFSHRNLGLMA